MDINVTCRSHSLLRMTAQLSPCLPSTGCLGYSLSDPSEISAPDNSITGVRAGKVHAQYGCYQDVWYWNLTYALHSKIISDCNFVPGCALSAQTPHRTHGCAICKYIWTRKFWAPARKQNISRKIHLFKEDRNLHGGKNKPSITLALEERYRKRVWTVCRLRHQIRNLLGVCEQERLFWKQKHLLKQRVKLLWKASVHFYFFQVRKIIRKKKWFRYIGSDNWEKKNISRLCPGSSWANAILPFELHFFYCHL